MAERSQGQRSSRSNPPNTRSRNRWNRGCRRFSIHSCQRKYGPRSKPWNTSPSSSAGTTAATASEKYFLPMIKVYSPCAESSAASAACLEAKDQRLINEARSPQRHRDTEEFLDLGFCGFWLFCVSLCLCGERISFGKETKWPPRIQTASNFASTSSTCSMAAEPTPALTTS